jgi:alkylation response protein AidB-like acyl-CoA dehydrogenase
MAAPLFDPAAFRLAPEEAAVCAMAREFGEGVLAPRAARWDREARFPTENYRDMATLLHGSTVRAH